MEVLSIQSVSYNQWRMFAYIIRQLQGIPNVHYHVVDGNIYIKKGKASSYPCMVAHMDTVHAITDDLHPLEFNGMITGFDRVNMEQTGIGGDDKVGVYIALECLREFDDIKIAFFRDEEVGCIGSYDCSMEFFEDCRFVLQCDRKGNTDFITDASGIELSSDAFQNDVLPIISNYGYKFAKGMMTDVMALKENGIKCSVANISCGYYNPHTSQEFVDIYDVDNCLEMCKTIIRYCTKNYKHKYKARQSYAYKPLGVGYTKPVTHWDWAEPKKSNTIEWGSDYSAHGKAFGHGEEYCKDCWGDYAVKDGLCSTCSSWYSGEYGGHTF